MKTLKAPWGKYSYSILVLIRSGSTTQSITFTTLTQPTSLSFCVNCASSHQSLKKPSHAVSLQAKRRGSLSVCQQLSCILDLVFLEMNVLLGVPYGVPTSSPPHIPPSLDTSLVPIAAMLSRWDVEHHRVEVVQ